MPAIKGQIYNDYLTLPSYASYGIFMQVTPTIVAGDVKVVKDGGAPANIGTLPTVSGTVVTYTLSATETNADSILVLFKDQAGDEWVDVTVKIETEASGGGGLTLAEIEASTVLAKQSGFTGLATATNVTNAQTAIIAEIDAIPTNPLLTNDARLNNLDAAVSTRLASASYVAPSNSDISAIKAKTDNLTFSQAGIVDANIQYVNDVQVKGTGTELDPWNPV